MTMHQFRPATHANRFKRPMPRDGRAQIATAQTAEQSYERYMTLAKAEALAGDRIEAERFYQYAEHHLRSMGENSTPIRPPPIVRTSSE
jgi:uncharacterized protein YbjT (DUF2867 family)